MFETKLYAVTKTGNIKTWRCLVNDLGSAGAEVVIITQTKIDGKEVVRRDLITRGKNIGKSNETTPYEQAVSEATSRMNKKIDQGYRTEIPTDTTKASSNSMDLPKPMLAHPIEKVKNVTFPACFQPKLNGHRAIVTKRDGKMLMYSRQGKPITSMDHILVYLDEVMNDGDFLDGELYVHGEMLQNIGSLIKRKQDGSENVEYWVYDTILDVPYSERYAWLQTKLSRVNRLSRVHLLSAVRVTSMEKAGELTEQAVCYGYEGGILRLDNAGYEAGFRSRNLLKMKSFTDEEFMVIDIIRGKTRNVNDVWLEMAILVCQTRDGNRFEVTAHGDMYEKDRIWRERKNHIGRLVTVKYYETTAAGIPFHPIALQWFEPL